MQTTKAAINEHFHSRVMIHDASGFLLSLDGVDGNVRLPGAWHRGSRCPASWARQMTFFINTIAVIALTDQFPVEGRELAEKLMTPEAQQKMSSNSGIVMSKIAVECRVDIPCDSSNIVGGNVEGA